MVHERAAANPRAARRSFRDGSGRDGVPAGSVLADDGQPPADGDITVRIRCDAGPIGVDPVPMGEEVRWFTSGKRNALPGPQLRPRSGRLSRLSNPSAFQVQVVMGGGVRRGSDVVKPVALDTRTVTIGRAHLGGLAATGQSGVENVLDVLRAGIDSALLGVGVLTTNELDPGLLLVPEIFHRSLGDSARDRAAVIR